MPGAFTEQPAVETPDGDLRVFTAPTAWGATIYVSVNGIVQWRGFSQLSSTQIEFDTAPAAGDTIAFLYAQP